MSIASTLASGGTTCQGPVNERQSFHRSVSLVVSGQLVRTIIRRAQVTYVPNTAKRLTAMPELQNTTHRPMLCLGFPSSPHCPSLKCAIGRYATLITATVLWPCSIQQDDIHTGDKRLSARAVPTLGDVVRDHNSVTMVRVPARPPRTVYGHCFDPVTCL